jgi:hypothetical protein
MHFEIGLLGPSYVSSLIMHPLNLLLSIMRANDTICKQGTINDTDLATIHAHIHTNCAHMEIHIHAYTKKQTFTVSCIYMN